MNANVSFRHMESSSSLREYAESKLARTCDKYVQGKVDATAVMSVEKHWHIADFTLYIKGFTVKAKERSEDMYSSIDLALDKIEKQLRRHKDRLKDRQQRSTGHSRLFRMGVVAPLDNDGDFEDSDFAEDYELYPAPEEPSEVAVDGTDGAVEVEVEGGSTVKVLRNQEYSAQPMSLEEAVVQLDLLSDREFYIFTNAESQNINIVYKRHDGNVGLIETA
ncbi:ribosome hibernation-promoting factor, HPF/YfiA family [Bradymonas sediminis]|uniref:Ribosome hibernation promoting factor n=1 Tax=Bradymonas sediminis TaxID=1548548 RepID=A0A2Z4FPW1_9DELT|nr:ribosome-associated translation inhibitor RaiA [Bradymonas sediminis]AWV91067.1 ribosome-associated translation inhibitor RaiA [Bradymonas sediminis]TDP75191.1 putative sigma-54 modulation protein [Bradymonas sediminis]